MVSSSTTGTPFPKWQIAIALGTTGAIGLGYWYLRNNKNSRKTKITDVNGKSIATSAVNAAADENLTPLKRAQLHKTDGNNSFVAGKYDEAIAHYNKAIETCPKEKKIDLATFYQNRAAAYEQLKKWSAVKEDSTKALELNPTYIKALYRRAKACEATNDLVQALEDITEVCILEKFNNQTTLYMADRVLRQLGAKHAKEAMKSRKPIMPSKHFIKVYFSTFTEDPVLKYLKDDTKLKDETHGFARAIAAMKKQNYDDIISACTEEIDSSESEAQFKLESQLLRGTFYLLVGRHQDALTDLQSIIDNKEAEEKLRVNALIKMAALNMQLENSNQSMVNFEEAFKLDASNCDLFHHRAQVNLLLGNLSAARDDFKKAVDINPNYAVAHAQKCYAEYRQAVGNMDVEKLQSVMLDFEKLTKKFPNCCECYALYAQALTDQQKYEEADQFFQRTIEADPDNPTVYVQRAVLQLQWNSDMEKSIQLINKALEIDEKCEYAYEALGTIEIQRGNLSKAIELFEKALVLAKNETEMTHLFSLKDAAVAQQKISEKLGLEHSAFNLNS